MLEVLVFPISSKDLPETMEEGMACPSKQNYVVTTL